MKRIIIGLSVIALVFMITGCNQVGGGKANEELKAKIDELQAQIDDLNDMVQDLQEQFDEHMEKFHKPGKVTGGGTRKTTGTGGKLKPPVRK